MRYWLRRAGWLPAVLLVIGAAWSCTTSDEAVETQGAATKGGALANDVDDDIGWNTAYSAGIIGSKHDFTQQGAHPRDLCTPCHTPHITGARAPLLDEGSAARHRLQIYQAYGVELDSASMLCMSCHDGVIAGDVFTSAHSTRLARQLGSDRFGMRGLTSHPIGVRYPLVDARYRPISAVTAGGRVPLPDGAVQCISCHDPHNRGRHPAMLVQSNSGSRLCLACHRL